MSHKLLQTNLGRRARGLLAWKGGPPIVAAALGALGVIAWQSFESRGLPNESTGPAAPASTSTVSSHWHLGWLQGQAADAHRQTPASSTQPAITEIQQLLDQRAKPALAAERRLLILIGLGGGKRLATDVRGFQSQLATAASTLTEVQSSLERITSQNHAELDALVGNTAALAQLNSEIQALTNLLAEIPDQPGADERVSTAAQSAAVAREHLNAVNAWIGDCDQRLAALAVAPRTA